MKNLTLAFFFLTVSSIVACHKSKSSSSSENISPIGGLSGVRYSSPFDSAGATGFRRYLTWKFSGTNPILATPISDTIHFGRIQMFFTGKNVTRLVYTGGSSSVYDGMELKASYNDQNMLDTVTMTYQGYLRGRLAFVFEYTGTQVSKITDVRSFLNDTLSWATPNAYYYYYYDGGNIALSVTQTLQGSVGNYRTDSVRFTTNTIKNNFAGITPVYLLVEFMMSIHDVSYFPYQLPLFLGANAVDGVNGYPAYSYLTDSKGRITDWVAPGALPPDTCSFYY